MYPAQKLPIRAIVESRQGTPGTPTLGTSVPTAPNLDSAATSSAPHASQLCASVVAVDSVTIQVSGIIPPGDFGGQFSKKVTFANIPVSQSSRLASLRPPIAVQGDTFTPPPGVLAMFYVWAVWSGFTGNLLPTALVVQVSIRDTTSGATYTGHQLSPGVSYKEFGTTVSGGFHNPTGVAVNYTGTIDVYGKLVASYPGANAT